MIFDREYQLAAARFPQLAKFVCSAPWLVAIVVSGPDSRTKERFRKMYPPGREQSRMRVCAPCGRLTPPNGQERAWYRQQIHLMLNCIAAACPKGWRLTDEDSMSLDEAERMVVDARRQRNRDRFLEALTQYERTALAIFCRWKSEQNNTAVSGTF
jgi:hypothetical protein